MVRRNCHQRLMPCLSCASLQGMGGYAPPMRCGMPVQGRRTGFSTPVCNPPVQRDINAPVRSLVRQPHVGRICRALVLLTEARALSVEDGHEDLGVALHELGTQN